MTDASPDRMDDAPLFSKSFFDILRTEGYCVAASNGGRAGIDAFEAALNDAQPFAAAVTDLGMRVVGSHQT